MRRLAACLLAAVLAAFLCPLPAQAQTRADQWRAIAETALARFEQLDTGAERSATLAFALQGTSRLYGWSDPRIPTLLDRIYSLQNPDGGYGLGYAWDALSDGTTNPATTTYTVSLAGHVGPVLLAGYRAGVVPRDKVQAIVNLLMTTPRIPGALSAYGQCVAYSRAAADTVAHGCVHNVNAGVAAFLLDANSAGIGRTGLSALVVDLVRRETFAYRPGTADWLYMDTRTSNDPDHNSYSAESMYRLVPPLGAEAAYQMMVRSWPDDPLSPIVHMRLTGLPPIPSRMSGGTTQWCVLGDQWIPEATAYQQAQAGDAFRQAQISWYAAQAAESCQEES